MPKGQAKMADKNFKPKLAPTHADQFRQTWIQTKNRQLQKIQTKSDKFRQNQTNSDQNSEKKNQTNSEQISDKFRKIRPNFGLNLSDFSDFV